MDICEKNSGVKFSVITVVLNGCDVIQETVSSVVRQSHSSIEYIVIDGGSTDGTLNVLRSNADEIDCLVSEPDKGIYDAMNKGIERATGDFLCFMNSGDTFASVDVLRTMAECVQAKSPDFLYGDSMVRDSTRLFYKKARTHRWAWYGMFTNHQSMFYRREIVERERLRYDLTYRIAADYDFTISFLKRARGVAYIPRPVSVFRKGGLSEQQMEAGARECDRVRRETLDYSVLTRFAVNTVIAAARFASRYASGIYGRLRYEK